MRSNYKRLGDYIQEVNIRNNQLQASRLLGINIDKFFMPSVANVIGTDLSKYKLVKKGQFACNRMHVGRDKRIPIALFKDEEEIIVSPAYTVFEIIDVEVLNPEYLMMWFSRSEFDRNAWFFTDADVRGGLNWSDVCNMKLPVPSIEKQREIVKEYHVLVERFNLNNRLIEKLEETAQAIYKRWFVDFEFPDEAGKPYKSNGGEMVFNEELDMEIPKGWAVRQLSEFCVIKGGKRLPKGQELNFEKKGNPYIKVANMNNSKYIVLDDKFQYVDDDIQKDISRYIVEKDDVIISIVGTIGLLNIIDESLHEANLTENCAKLTNFSIINSDFLYHYLFSSLGQRIIKAKTVGGVQGKLPLYNIQSVSILCPKKYELDLFKSLMSNINVDLKNKTKQNAKITVMKNILLSKLATLEDNQ